MFGIGGMNPKNMEKMMKQLGMNTVAIDADEVIIRCKNKEIVISNPSVQKISIAGQESFQITGISEEKAIGAEGTEAKQKFSEDDVQLVMEKTKCTKKQAIQALQETGNIAEAIMHLQNKQI